MLDPTTTRSMNGVRLLGLAMSALIALACGGRDAPTESQSAGGAAAPAPVADQDAPLVAFLGDSLTAGYDIPEHAAYPARIESALRSAGVRARVLNAGVSGDTSAGGLRRLSWVLRQRPSVVVIALGANDGLRGLDVVELEDNLRRIVKKVRDAGVTPVLAGMRIPPNYGPEYTQRFDAVYPRLARELDVPLIPFLLDGVAGRKDMTLPDGIHPTAEAHGRIAATVLPFVREALDPGTAPGAAQGRASR